MPRVSVIMPAYNCAAYIGPALESVLRQTERDFEVVVVDDGSTDGTLAIAREAASRDARIAIHTQPHSGKPAVARNRALAVAQGDFVSFLDADDLYHPEKLERQLALLAGSEALGLVFHDVKYIDASGADLSGTYLGRADFRTKVLSRCRPLERGVYECSGRDLFFFMCTRITTMYTSSVLVRRSRLHGEAVFFPEDVTLGEDLDLWFRLVSAGGVAYIDRVLSSYRQHAASITKRHDRNLHDPIEAHLRNYARARARLDARERRAYRRRIAADLTDIAYLCRQSGLSYRAALLYGASLRWRFRLRTLRALAKTCLAGLPVRRQMPSRERGREG
jgi:glycosyltransferase involved in cell wall biosynthesis